MNRRMWTGVAVGVLAATMLVGVAAGAYRAGRHHEVTRGGGEGEVVRVTGGHGWGYGPGPGFILFPLLAIGVVALLAAGRRGPYGGWHPPGPGPWARSGAEAAFQEWHRRAHEDPSAPTTGAGPAGAGTSTAPPG